MKKKTTVKRWLSYGTPITLGAALLVGSGFSASASTSGYEIYKQALKANSTLDSVTANVQVSVTDNGAQEMAVDADVKLDKANKEVSGTLQLASAGNEAQTLQAFRQNEEMYVGNPSKALYYHIISSDDEGEDDAWEAHAKGPHPQAEKVIDALVGDVKDQVKAVQQEDGSTKLELDLSGNEIPAIVRTVAPIVIQHDADEKGDSFGPPWAERGEQHEDSPLKELFQPLDKPDMPELTNNVRLASIELDATVDAAGHLQNQTVEVTVTGEDETGEAHELTITMEASFSAFNNTTPDQLSLDEIDVQQVDIDKHDKGFDRR
ncbi:hypothetical protein [Aureibacillus halotolerans]|uniref:Uncharacterized protein n=1 Tax=Aureibacillus halotolerans TaxID=1508390 RepID=A0A4R6TSJ2_9BACI|nr:hypothetical protein [Aureibacillus halotolerans]TDQ36598.1 hypothetical protein EV213_11762 [Aureibacillus halotolerans]